MAKNNNLHTAKSAKNDEFYTRIEDVEKELKNYKDFFKGKKVLCNCNDGRLAHNGKLCKQEGFGQLSSGE